MPNSRSFEELPGNFRRRLTERLSGQSEGHIVAAVSGGVDSMVLLHLLRFHTEYHGRLAVAHFDHRMRPGSESDSNWLRGVCTSWNLPFHSGVATRPLRSEAEARQDRYRFLEQVRRQVGGVILTAHHRDDQAETVLFRILRGAGIRGLSGMPEMNDAGVMRPLLDTGRKEIERYAEDTAIRWREDPSNQSDGFARNDIRLNLLPVLVRASPTTTSNLIAVSRAAGEMWEATEGIVDLAYGIVVHSERGELLLDRSGIRELPPLLSTHVVRLAIQRAGCTLDRPGTRSAIQFITDAPSGRTIHLPGGLRMTTSFDHVRLHRPVEKRSSDVGLAIERGMNGFRSELVLGGSKYEVVGSVGETDSPTPDGARWRARFALEERRFPLLLRGRRSGDRIRLSGGAKTLKKLMIEHRIPVWERATRPILCDAAGEIVWVAGLRPPEDPVGPIAILDLAIFDA